MITTSKFSKQNDIAAFLKRTDFDDKPKNLNKNVTSNKTKYVEAEKTITDLRSKVTQISKKGYEFLLGRMYFPENEAYHNFQVFAQNCLFGTVKLTRNADKSEFTYNAQDIAFDGKGYWSLDNDTAYNVVNFGVDNSSSSHIDNPKNNFLVLGKGPSEGINASVGSAEKILALT